MFLQQELIDTFQVAYTRNLIYLKSVPTIYR